MLKKYNEYINESLLNRLEGPTQQEIIENFKNNPDKLLRYSIDNEYLEGVELALENGANPNVDNYSLFLYNRKDKEKIIDLLFEYSNIPRSENDLTKILFNNIEPEYSNSDGVVKYKNEYGVLFYFTVFGSDNYLEIPNNVYYLFFNVYNKSKQEIHTLFEHHFNLPNFNIHISISSSFKIEKLLYDNLKGLNESLLNHLNGPNEDDVFNHFKNSGNYDKLMRYSIETFFIKGIKYVIDEIGINPNKYSFEILKQFDLYTKEMYESGIIKYLLEKGLDISKSSYKIFRICCYYGYYDLVKTLLEKGAPAMVLNNQPIYQAAMNGHLNVVKILHEYGADIHALETDAPLRFAAVMGHKDVVEYCLQFGIVDEEKVVDTLDDIKDKEVYDLLKKYLINNGYLKESLLNHLEGPSKEEVSKNLKEKFNKDNDVLFYLNELVKNELVEDIVDAINELNFNVAYIPYVIKKTFIYNKQELRELLLFELLNIDANLFNHIKIAVKTDVSIKMGIDVNNAYNKLDILERKLKQKNII